MKRQFLFFVTILFAVAAYSQDAQGILDKLISQYRKDKTISANFTVSSTQGQSAGVVVMSGSKFRLISDDVKCWYDGAVQWTFSTSTDEVNITKPTTEELQMSNPYSAISSFKAGYNITLMKSDIAGNYLLKLTPKKPGGDIKEIRLSVSKQDNRLTKVDFTMNDNSFYSIVISNYRAGGNYPDSTFVFNKKDVPPGTPVVDLR